MYDVGSPWAGSIAVKDATGALANATAVVLTITLPDGTTVTPAVSNPSAGNYTATYLTTQAGRHVVNWVATGTNASTYTDVFDVVPSAATFIVSLADTKAWLNMSPSNTGSDDKLRGAIGTATAVIESYVGACVRRVVTEHHSGEWTTPTLIPRVQPVISMTSVTETGNLLTQGVDYNVSDEGYVTRLAGVAPRGWWLGVNNITLSYIAGRAVIGYHLLEAAKDLIAINWRSQRGTPAALFDDGAGAEATSGDQIRLGFYVPTRILQLLAPDFDLPGGFW